MPSIDLASMKYGQELLKRGFATMQEGGVIMDVVDAEQAAVAEDAGALEHDLRAELAPLQLRGVLLGAGRDDLIADLQPALDGRHVAPEGAVDRVVLEQVREGLVVREVVDADDLEVAVRVREDGAGDATPDAPESVDADLGGHVGSPSGFRCGSKSGARARRHAGVSAGNGGLLTVPLGGGQGRSGRSERDRSVRCWLGKTE